MESPVKRPKNFENVIAAVPYLTRTEKKLLRQIAFHCYEKTVCWPEQKFLAAAIECDVRTVRRALDGIRIEDRPERPQIGLPLVRVTRVRGRSYSYSIHWPVVVALAEGKLTPEEARSGAILTGQMSGEMSAQMSAVTGQMSGDMSAQMSGEGGGTLYSENKKQRKDKYKSGKGGAEDLISEEKRGTDFDVLRWSDSFDRTMLQYPRPLQALYEAATREGLVKADQDRVRFFVSACYVVRRSAYNAPDPIQNPGGYFRDLVEGKQWAAGNQQDEANALRMLRSLDRSHKTPAPGSVQCGKCQATYDLGYSGEDPCPKCGGREPSASTLQSIMQSLLEADA